MSEPIYGRWFTVQDVPISTDPDAWIVTARRHGEVGFESGDVRIITSARAHLPGRVFKPSDIDGFTPALAAEVWLRIPPPPWMEGK